MSFAPRSFRSPSCARNRFMSPTPIAGNSSYGMRFGIARCSRRDRRATRRRTDDLVPPAERSQLDERQRMKIQTSATPRASASSLSSAYILLTLVNNPSSSERAPNFLAAALRLLHAFAIFSLNSLKSRLFSGSFTERRTRVGCAPFLMTRNVLTADSPILVRFIISILCSGLSEIHRSNSFPAMISELELERRSLMAPVARDCDC